MAIPCATTVAFNRRRQNDLIKSFVCFGETALHISVSRALEAYASSAERMEAEASSVGTSKLEWQHGDSDALCGQASSGNGTSDRDRRRERQPVISCDTETEYEGRSAFDQLHTNGHLRCLVRARGSSKIGQVNLSVVPRDDGLVDGSNSQSEAARHRRHRDGGVCFGIDRGQVSTRNGGESSLPLRVYAGKAPSKFACDLEPVWPAAEAKQASASIDLLRALCVRAGAGLREGITVLDRRSEKAGRSLRRPAPQVQAIEVLVGRSMAVVGGADVLHRLPCGHSGQLGVVAYQEDQWRAELRSASQGRQQNQTRRDQSDTPAALQDARANPARQVALRVAMARASQGALDFSPTIATPGRNTAASRTRHSRLATYARHRACVAWCAGCDCSGQGFLGSPGPTRNGAALRQHRIGSRASVAESILVASTIQLPVRSVSALRRAPGRVRCAVGVFVFQAYCLAGMKKALPLGASRANPATFPYLRTATSAKSGGRVWSRQFFLET